MESFIEFMAEIEFIGGGAAPAPPPVPPDEYTTLKAAALAAAAANSAALWFLGRPADLVGNVYTDSAGTTQAVVNDPVGLMKDRNGDLFPASQPSSGAKPTIALLGSGYCAMTMTAGQTWEHGFLMDAAQDHTIIAAAVNVTVSGMRTIFGSSQSGFRYPQFGFNMGASDGPARGVYYYNAGADFVVPVSPSSYSPSSPPVIALKKSGAALTMYVSGIAVDADTLPASTDVMFESSIGAFNISTEPFDGQLAMVCVAHAAMSDSDREDIERFGALLSGATYP